MDNQAVLYNFNLARQGDFIDKTRRKYGTIFSVFTGGYIEGKRENENPRINPRIFILKLDY